MSSRYILIVLLIWTLRICVFLHRRTSWQSDKEKPHQSTRCVLPSFLSSSLVCVALFCVASFFLLSVVFLQFSLGLFFLSSTLFVLFILRSFFSLLTTLDQVLLLQLLLLLLCHLHAVMLLLLLFTVSWVLVGVRVSTHGSLYLWCVVLLSSWCADCNLPCNTIILLSIVFLALFFDAACNPH